VEWAHSSVIQDGPLSIFVKCVQPIKSILFLLKTTAISGIFSNLSCNQYLILTRSAAGGLAATRLISAVILTLRSDGRKPEKIDSSAIDVHHEVVHRPVWLDTVLAHKSGKLRIVPNAVQSAMKKNGLTFGAGRTHSAGGEFDGDVPINTSVEKLLQDANSAIVRCVDRLNGVEGNVIVLGDWLVGESLSEAKFDSDDVLEELGDGPPTRDVAWSSEKFRMASEKLAPTG
jgi:hypothetical protein